MAAPLRVKRALEKDAPALPTAAASDKRARLVYDQVALVHLSAVEQFLKDGIEQAAEDLIEGLSDRDFEVLERVAKEGASPGVQSLLAQMHDTRADRAEVAKMILSQQDMDLSVSLQNMSMMPRDLVLHQANSFLSDKEASYFARSNKSTLEDMYEGYNVKGAVDAVEYLKGGGRVWFGRTPTRFKNVDSLATLFRLPAETTHIQMGYHFNGSFEGAIFPRSLEELVLGGSFRASLARVAFPDSIRTLVIKGYFNGSLVKTHLPNSLETLTLGNHYNQPLVGVKFPNSLRSLTLGSGFNQPLEGVVFSDSLQVLTFGHFFNQPLAGIVFPSLLKELTIGATFEQTFTGVVFPLSLRKLTLHSDILRGNLVLPSALEELEVGSGFDGSQLRNVVIPATLKKVITPQPRYFSQHGLQLPEGCVVVSTTGN